MKQKTGKAALKNSSQSSLVGVTCSLAFCQIWQIFLVYSDYAADYSKLNQLKQLVQSGFQSTDSRFQVQEMES